MNDITDDKWYEKEFANLNFGDKRLSKRFLKICAEFNATPQAIVSHAIEDFHQCKAAYRFWNNKQVIPKSILDCHANSMKSRIKNSEEYILELQDTSELNFSSHFKTSGLGPIAEGNHLKGLEMHSSIIATESGLILGIGSCYLWAREPVNKNKGKSYRKVPWENKESIKWARALEEVDRIGIKNRVTVTDREGDIFALLEKAEEEERKMIIRLKNNRKIKQSDKKIKEYIESQAVVGTYIIEVLSKGGLNLREKRSAEIEVRFGQVDCLYGRPSKNQRKVKVTVIHAKEINPPNREEPIEWFLITNLACNNLENVIRIIKCYTKRWLAEEFHKILKGGMKIEEARLGTKKRLENLIVFLAIIACRMLWINRLSRLDPNLPCGFAFEKEEWEFIMQRVYKKVPSNSEMPSIDQIVIGIAKMGGYWGRKSDPPPGIMALWRGWMKLQDALETIKELRLLSS